MCVYFHGKCILPSLVIREGKFRLVDPAMRMELCGKFGEDIQRYWWETGVHFGYHSLGFDNWKGRQTDLFTQLKCLSKTPLK